MWYDILVKDEFINYFCDDNNVFFTIENGEEILAPTFLRFRKIVGGVSRAFTYQERIIDFSQVLEDIGEYDMLEGFNFCTEQIAHLGLGRDYLIDLWHSIQTTPECSKYDVPTEEISAEQCAVLIMYQFWGRMGVRTETLFQESGELKRYLLALKQKVEEANG